MNQQRRSFPLAPPRSSLLLLSLSLILLCSLPDPCTRNRKSQRHTETRKFLLCMGWGGRESRSHPQTQHRDLQTLCKKKNIKFFFLHTFRGGRWRKGHSWSISFPPRELFQMAAGSELKSLRSPAVHHSSSHTLGGIPRLGRSLWPLLHRCTPSSLRSPRRLPTFSQRCLSAHHCALE